MGQDWAYFCPDKKESTNMMGKFGEFFFDSDDMLLRRLMVPACPQLYSRSASDFGEEKHYTSCCWAGARLILFGENSNRIPKNFCTRNEIETLIMAGDSDLTLLERIIDNTQRQSNPSFDSIYASGGASFPVKFPWVIRNLSKQEYIRSDGIPYPDDVEETLQIATGYYSTMSQALMCVMGWSSDSSISMDFSLDEYDFHRGAWAGDRLDIRLLDDVEEDLWIEGWKNVSKQTSRMICDVYVRELEWKVGEELCLANMEN